MLKAQVGAGADSEARTLLKTVVSMGPGAAHPFHEYRSGSRLPRRQACRPHDAGHALTAGSRSGRRRRTRARQHDDDVGGAAVGDHGDRARVGCGDLRPPGVVRPGTRRFLAGGGELRVAGIERERLRGRLRGGVRGDQRRRTRTTQRARASSLGPGGDRELTGPARGQLAVQGQGYLAVGRGDLEVPGRDFRGWTGRSRGRACRGGGRAGRL
jgi:hypothetical protein